MKALRSAAAVDALCLAGVGLPIVLTASSRMLFPYDTGHGEALVWEPARLLASGQNPYELDRITRPPYVISGYGPLYYLLVGLGLRLGGLQLWTGRLASLVGCLVAGAIVGRLSFLLTRSRRLALVSVVAYLGQYPVQMWVGIQRPDFISLALSLAGLWAAFAGREPSALGRGPVGRMFLAAVLLSVGLLVRQTALLPVALAVFWCVRRRQLPALLAFLGTLAVLVGAAVWALEATSDGGFLTQTWSMPASLPKRPDVTAVHLFALFAAPTTWVLAAIVGLAAVRAGPSLGGPGGREIALVLGASFALALVTSSIPGANVNYYLEACAAVAILVAPLWQLLRPRAAEPSRGPTVLAVAILLASLVTTVRIFRGEYFRWRARGYLDELVAAMSARVPPGVPCFSVWPELVTAAGRDYYVNNWVAYALWPAEQRERLTGWPERLQRTFEDLVASCELGALVTHSLRPPPGYRLVALRRPPPVKFSQVFLHVRACAPRGATSAVP